MKAFLKSIKNPPAAILVAMAGFIAGLSMVTLYFAVSASRLNDENVRLHGEMNTIHKQTLAIEGLMTRVDAYTEILDELANSQLNRDDASEQKAREHLAQIRNINNKLKLFQNEEEAKLNLVQRIDNLKQSASKNERIMRTMVTILSHHKDILNTIPSITPVNSGWLSSFFGERKSPFSGEDLEVHRGIDFGAEEGTPVYAAADGEVYFSGNSTSFGRLVVIKHANNVFSKYAHNSKLTVAQGDKVRRGQKISAVGTTGRSTGDHLHYEIWVGANPVDPLDYLLDRELADLTALSTNLADVAPAVAEAKASVRAPIIAQANLSQENVGKLLQPNTVAESPAVKIDSKPIQWLFVLIGMLSIVVLAFGVMSVMLRLQTGKSQLS